MDNVVKSLSVERARSPSADKFIVKQPTQVEAEEAVRTLIRWAGDDPSRRSEERRVGKERKARGPAEL